MTEDELLVGVTDALTAGRWLWHHVRRSDIAQQMGSSGFPDIVACHPERQRLLVLELKTEKGRTTPLQDAWLDAFGRAGVEAWIVRPADYDALIDELVGDRLVKRRTA